MRRVGLRVGLHRRFDTPGNSLAELRMKASSEETWMKAANNGFSIPTAASAMPMLSTASVPAKLNQAVRLRVRGKECAAVLFPGVRARRRTLRRPAR